MYPFFVELSDEEAEIVQWTNTLYENNYRMLALVLNEAYRSQLPIRLHSMTTMKRGGCTFVDKAKNLAKYAVDYGVLVNSEETLIDMPAGKENTSSCTTPFAITRESDGKDPMMNSSSIWSWPRCPYRILIARSSSNARNTEYDNNCND